MTDGIGVENVTTTGDFASLDAVGPVKVLIGIPTLNHARSVAHVVAAGETGLRLWPDD
jgi:hypothetical protein